MKLEYHRADGTVEVVDVDALRAEVAALREECGYWREYMPRVAKENTEARALLARWDADARAVGLRQETIDGTRAFLRRDEARRVYCHGCEQMVPDTDDHSCPGNRRDEGGER